MERALVPSHRDHQLRNDGSCLDIRFNVNRVGLMVPPVGPYADGDRGLHCREAGAAGGRQQRGVCPRLFDPSPVSLWVEDFSEVKSPPDDVREQGITGLRTLSTCIPSFSVVPWRASASLMSNARPQPVLCEQQGTKPFGAAAGEIFVMKWAFVRRATARLLAWQSVPVAKRLTTAAKR